MVDLVCLTLPYARYPLQRALQGVAGAGYRATGLGLTHEGQLVPSALAGAAELRRLRDQVRRHGLRTAVLFGPRGEDEPRVDQYRRRIDQAVALEAPLIQTAGAWGYRRFPDAPLSAAELRPAHQAFVEDMRRIAPYAGQAGVVIALKPHTGSTATGPLLRQTLEEIDSPAVRACWDAGNVRYYEGLDPADDLLPVAAEVHSVVAKDHRGGRAHADFPVPGDGEVDFRRIFVTLAGHGFDGPAVVERVDGTGGTIAPDALDQRLTRAREYLQRTIAGAGLRLSD